MVTSKPIAGDVSIRYLVYQAIVGPPEGKGPQMLHGTAVMDVRK